MLIPDLTPQAAANAQRAALPKRPPPRRHPFSLQCLRVAARSQTTNICLAPASIDAVVRLLAEGMQPRHRAATLQRLDPPPGPLAPEAGASYQLHHGTALFIDGNSQFEPAFLPRAEGTGAHLERLPGSLSEGQQVINEYAAEHAMGPIQNIFSNQVLSQNSLLLLDVIGFKANWEKKFLPAATVNNFPFRISPTRTSPCAMMFKHGSPTFVCEHSNYLAIDLRYETDYMRPWAEFTALMPQNDATIDDVLRTLQREGFPERYTRESLERLGLPKFKFEHTQTDLMSLLQASGLTALNEPLQITRGINQSLNHAAQVVSVEVDEEGTVARAKTMMLAGPTRAPYRPTRSIVFDRPFVFLIRTNHSPSHLLFAGIYTHETAT